MPIYEYQCAACGHELEALQKMSDDALIYCPECHAETLKKKISAAAFQLKGSGWYETDFKNSGAKPKEQDTAMKTATKTAESTEKKPTSVSSSKVSSKDSKSSGTSHSSGTGSNHSA